MQAIGSTDKTCKINNERWQYFEYDKITMMKFFITEASLDAAL